MKKFVVLTIISLTFSWVFMVSSPLAQMAKKPLDKVRLHVAARSLTFIPYYYGKAKGLYEQEGIDLEIIVMRPPVGVMALQASEVDYSASTGLSVRGAMKGLPLRAVMFSQTKLSFSLIGQPGMTAAKLRNVGVSGIGSLAHYAATIVMKRLNNEKVAYIATNTTANSFATLTSKAADAVILSPPYTSMATLAGYTDLGNTFDVRDMQGGMVVRVSHLQNHRDQVKAMIRATVRSLDLIAKNREDATAFLQNYFKLEPKVAADSYRILREVLTFDGDIEDAALKSIIERLRQESNISAEVSPANLVDLSLLREVRSELTKRK